MKFLIVAAVIASGFSLTGCSTLSGGTMAQEPKTLFPSATRKPERNRTYAEPVMIE